MLNDISLHIPQGKIVCLLGPSGSGKTTLIRIILGAIPADSGEVRIADTIVPNRPLLSRIGFMPQQDALYENLSAIDNLAFFAGLYGIDRKTFRRRADEALLLVGLEADRDKLVAKFSGGMKKRVSLARAIAIEPSIIFYDEPSSGLDPIMTEKIDELIINTQKALSVTSIVVTHDMASACRISDRIAMIYEGDLIAIDTVERFKKIQDARVQAFFRTLRTVKTEKEDKI